MDVRRFALLLILLPPAPRAQTMYVTDEVVITLRRGAGTEFAIIENLRSGDAVDVLERDDPKGYARVRLRDGGAEGWVLTRYLVDAPTANLELTDARAALAQARTRADALQSELTATEQRLEATQTELATLQSTSSAVNEELADIRKASASAIDLRDQNESLRRRNTELNAEVDQLVVDNAALANRNQQNWFIVGALVLAGGIVIGLVAPSLRRRRRTDW